MSWCEAAGGGGGEGGGREPLRPAPQMAPQHAVASTMPMMVRNKVLWFL